jgi:uncharacterized membrane protein HdeD (DUF308 family)
MATPPTIHAIICRNETLSLNKINPDILRKVFGTMLILSGGVSLVSSFVKNKQKKNI